MMHVSGNCKHVTVDTNIYQDPTLLCTPEKDEVWDLEMLYCLFLKHFCLKQF